MYNPAVFSVSDAKRIKAFIGENSFGIIFSQNGGVLHDTHTPFFLSDDLKTVSGHIARANPQWQSWRTNPEVKIVFHGPHAYISPRFYVSEFNVPTWNYTAISISGVVQVIEEPEVSKAVIQTLVERHEGKDGWKLDTEDTRYMKLLEAVVCFNVSITNIEAKFKLNQNKKKEDQESVISHLLASKSSASHDVAKLMQENNNEFN
ncbi:MAG: FMN-binding negative transcriptional regulator [Chthoniobacterales bacterium]